MKKLIDSNQKIKIIGIFFAIFILIAVFFLINPKLTGFLSLFQSNEKNNSIEKFENSSIDENNSMQNSAKKTTFVSSQISFEIVQPTELKIDLIDGNVFPCPQFSNIVFEIENVGEFKAERLFFNHSENLKIENCLNCSVKELLPKKKIKATAKACILLDKNALIEFSSINAEKKQFRIE